MRRLRGCFRIIGLITFGCIALFALTIYGAGQLTRDGKPAATNRPISSPTSSIRLITQKTYYLVRTANVRACANTACDKLGLVEYGTHVTVTGTTDGEAVASGNSSWYQIEYRGQSAFVYSAYLADHMPVTTQQAAQPAAAQQPAVVQPQPALDHPRNATAICNDGTYSFAANHRGSCSHHGGVAHFYNN